MRIIICDIQGFSIDGEFCVKELSFVLGDKISHFIMMPPKEFSSLSDKDKRTVKFLEKKLHGLRYTSGYIEYGKLPEILKSILQSGDIIYVNGHQKHDFFKNIMIGREVQVLNVEEHGWTPPKFEKKPPKCMSHILDQCMCTLSNCDDLYRWVCMFLPKVTLVSRHLEYNERNNG